MVSICVRRGLVGLVVAMLCVSMGCVDPKSSDGGKTHKELSNTESAKQGIGPLHHVVYLIDRSGSMFDILDAVKSDVMGSVRGLQQDQDFHVIMLADGEPLENKPMALAPPTDENKLSLARFFSMVRAEGTVDPIKGINRAFDVLGKANKRPGKIIHFLTDGSFPDYEAVIELIYDRNARKNVRIYTYIYGPQNSPIAEKVMKLIAAENGGKYRHINPDE